MQTKNQGWFDAGPFNQKPSIKTAPAQCPAAATGFIKLILGLCAMQELPSRQATPNQRWPNVGSPSTTLDQRHTKIDLTCRVRRAPHMDDWMHYINHFRPTRYLNGAKIYAFNLNHDT